MIQGKRKLGTRMRLAIFGLTTVAELVVGILITPCVSNVDRTRAAPSTETERTSSLREEWSMDDGSPQGPELDYANFKHSSQRHTSLACSACHQRKNASTTPQFPGHKACIGCHSGQFVTPNTPMCIICHTDVKSSDPPLKSFPGRFNDVFNVRFDHAQHMTGAARPQSGCSACHSRVRNRPAALSIPASLSAHNQCYTCHTPSSKSQSGREIASCGVCHEQKPYARTRTNAAAFRIGFSHADHGPRQRLSCAECHKLTAGASQSRQVSSPQPAEHFASGRALSCVTCHDGRRSFGGDLAFKDCKRCHEGATFR